MVPSSCGRVGTVDTVTSAMTVSEMDKLRVVAGGFHLATSKQICIKQDLDAPSERSQGVTIPRHCTDLNNIESMWRHLGPVSAMRISWP